jgi:type II secretory pathway pseudopilin PulG
MGNLAGFFCFRKLCVFLLALLEFLAKYKYAEVAIEFYTTTQKTSKSFSIQRGYGLIILVAVLLTISLSTIGLQTLSSSANALKLRTTLKNQQALEEAGRQLAVFLQTIPEIYATDSNENFYAPNRVPGPGYLPCPDTSQNQQSNAPCGQGRSFVWGRLPVRIASRHIHFVPRPASTPVIWYAVDSRYVIQNTDFNNPPTKRYSPLNLDNPGDGRLSLGSQTDLVALLFITDKSMPINASDLSIHNHPHLPDITTPTFIRKSGQFWVLTHKRWQRLITPRAIQAKELCTKPDSEPGWFNRCTNVQDPIPMCPAPAGSDPSNPIGNNWRESLC